MLEIEVEEEVVVVAVGVQVVAVVIVVAAAAASVTATLCITVGHVMIRASSLGVKLSKHLAVHCWHCSHREHTYSQTICSAP